MPHLTHGALAAGPEHTSAGASVRLRPMQRADEALLLAWQCEPGTRTLSRNPQPPTAAEHAAWLERKLADPTCRAMIILAGDQACGTLRLERRDDGSAEVHILVSQPWRVRGIAGAALRAGIALAPDKRLVAEIHPDNTASLRAFAGAGFVPRPGTRWHVREPTGRAAPGG